jgi:hypothetical protein
MVPSDPDPCEPDPVDDDFEDSWEPPRPALDGPGQILAAVVAAILVGLALLALAAAVSWLRP